MSTSNPISHEAILDVVEPGSTRATTIDIGGATNNSAYRLSQNFARIQMFAELGTWNGTDDLDECRLEQAVNTSGGSVKDLTTDASGGNYDTDNPIDADGDFVIIEVRGEDFDLDAATPFNVARGNVRELSDTGQDDCFSYVLFYAASYPQKEQQGAAVAASKLYINPLT